MAPRKPFTPKPFEHGDQVTWTHEASTGARVDRTGVIVCHAPTINGAATRWVVPDDPQPGDLYAVIPVARASRRFFSLATSIWSGGSTWEKGQLVSSSRAGTVTADLMVTAWRAGQQVKAERAAAAPAVERKAA